MTSSLLEDLPAGIDPCGEYGEFHSFVHDGPCFGRPVRGDGRRDRHPGRAILCGPASCGNGGADVLRRQRYSAGVTKGLVFQEMAGMT